jgi:hypothetical protein
LRQDMARPRTYNDLWRQHYQEQIDAGLEPESDNDALFSLSDPDNTLNMD